MLPFARFPITRIAIVVLAAALFVGLLVGPPPAADAGVWQSIGPEGGRTSGFAQALTDPDRLYLAMRENGVFRSDDRGNSWFRVDDGLPTLGLIAVSPVDEDLVIVAQSWEDRFHRSTDGGETWTATPPISEWSSVEEIEFDPIDSNRVLAAVSGAIGPALFVSTDAGLTWAGSSTGIDANTISSISFHTQVAGQVLVGAYDRVFRSSDAGATWSEVIVPGSPGTLWVDHCRAVPSRVWATGSSHDVFFSDDAGLSFEETPTSPPVGYYDMLQRVAAHPTDPQVVLGGIWQRDSQLFTRVGGVVRSGDGGSTWSVQTDPFHSGTHIGVVNGIAFDHDFPDVAYFSTRENAPTGLLRSQDGGVTWASWMNGIRHLEIQWIDWDASGNLYAREGGVNGLWVSPSIGTPWTYGAVHGFWRQFPEAFEVNHRATGLVLEAGRLEWQWDLLNATFSRSTDGGASWGIDSILPGNSPTSARALATNHGDGDAVYVWDSNYLHRSFDGTSFEVLNTEFTVSKAVIDPHDPMRVFAGDSGYGEPIRLSTDGGETWSVRSSGLPGSTYPRGLFMDPSAPDRLAVAFLTEIYRTDTGGIEWHPVPIGVDPDVRFRTVDWDPLRDRFAIATFDHGVYVTDRGFVNLGLPSLGGLDGVSFIPGTGHLVLGTSRYSAWTLDLEDPTATSGPKLVSTGIGLRVRPNPSGCPVRLDLSMPGGRTTADVAIYSVSGRRLVTLGRGLTTDGTLVWDGRDDRGVPVAAGVYFARAISGKEETSRKVVLIER